MLKGKKRFVKSFHSVDPTDAQAIRKAGIVPKKIIRGKPVRTSFYNFLDRWRPKTIRFRISDCTFFYFDRQYAERDNRGEMFEAEIDSKKAFVVDCNLTSVAIIHFSRRETGAREKRKAEYAAKVYWKSCIPMEYFLKYYESDGDHWYKKKFAPEQGPNFIDIAEVVCPHPVRNIHKVKANS